jgi:hypothetical protein
MAALTCELVDIRAKEAQALRHARGDGGLGTRPVALELVYESEGTNSSSTP